MKKNNPFKEIINLCRSCKNMALLRRETYTPLPLPQ